jgi:hypothetical protein
MSNDIAAIRCEGWHGPGNCGCSFPPTVNR